MNTNRRNGFRNQVRITGDVAATPRPRRTAYTLGRSRTSKVVIVNHLDELLPEVREVVERVASDRGVKLIDIRVISPTEAIVP